MFVLKKNPVAAHPVSWLSRDSVGAVSTATISLDFVRIQPERFDALFGPGGGGSESLSVVADANVAMVLKLAVGWAGVADETGAAVPFTAETVRQMIVAEPAFAAGVARAYVDFYISLPEAVLGNSGASPAGGPVTGDALTADPAVTATRSRTRSGQQGKTKPA